MSVQRYEFELYHCNGGDMVISETGDFVSHDDYAALEAKCSALAAELKQSQIDAGCYKHGMEASNARLVQVAAENAALKSAHPQPFGPEMMKALDAYEKHQDEVPETGMLDAFFILRDSIRVKTPVTDCVNGEGEAINENECSKAICAENAKLKEFISLECMVFGDNNNLLVAESFIPETPATDAFLAEVRAISLEDFADVMADSGHYDAANYATKHAHKIRQEAAQ